MDVGTHIGRAYGHFDSCPLERGDFFDGGSFIARDDHAGTMPIFHASVVITPGQLGLTKSKPRAWITLLIGARIPQGDNPPIRITNSL
jgi:hypothetical protein